MNIEAHITFVAVLLSILTLLISFIVYLIQRRALYDKAFRDCTKALHSKNPIEQTTSAILLRGYLKRKWFAPFSNTYAYEAKNLMVALLRQSIPVSLQKTIADNFSFVKNMDGQDMQYVNILGSSIKPLSAINYEICPDKDKRRKNHLKNTRIHMRNTDFFHSVIQESSINFVNAEGAVFISALLNGAHFNNCILKKANFRCANVHNVCFDQNCILEGAQFGGAVGLETAMVEINKKDSRPLIDFLDQEGVFHSKGITEPYSHKPEELNIFVSKLGAMDPQQTLRYRSVLSILDDIDNIKIESIERKDYVSISQLTDIATKMEFCDGCVIFAFEYLHVNAGHIHKNIIGEDCQVIKDKIFASPWLHIETAIANGKRMPCIIIYDKDLSRDGMFDDKIVLADKNLFAIPYSDTFTPSNKEITEWIANVREYHDCRKKTEQRVHQ